MAVSDRERSDDRFPSRGETHPPVGPRIATAQLDELADVILSVEEAAWQLERCRRARRVLNEGTC